MKSLSKMEYEGYTLLLNKSTGEHKIMCTSKVAEDLINQEKLKGHGIEERFFTFMCDEYSYIVDCNRLNKENDLCPLYSTMY